MNVITRLMKSHFNRHKNTKKHAHNVQKFNKLSKSTFRDPVEIQCDSDKETISYLCQYCDQLFRHKTNLYRHQKHSCLSEIENHELKKQNQELMDIRS